MARVFSIATALVLLSGQVAWAQAPRLDVRVVDRAPGTVTLQPAGLDAVHVPATQVNALRPLVWQTFGRGGRVFVLEVAAPQSAQWQEAADAIRWHFQANGTLLAQCRPGPSVTVERSDAGSGETGRGGRADGLEVALLEAQRTWVLVVTNLRGTAARATAQLPPDVPYAMWLNLLDGSSMAMLERADGPLWTFELPPWGVKVYVIDKTLK